MKDPTTIDTHFIKLSGKGNIATQLEIGRNYELRAQGTVTTKTESDNNDGSHSIYYRYEPVVIEVVNDKGESIKAKDPRSLSQLFRARLYRLWTKKPDNKSFEDYYNTIMGNLIQNADEIDEMYRE